jgi:hypothetical protein
MKNFYNSGFGWICKSCESDLKANSTNEVHGRLMREGEAESKTPIFSNSAMAKWQDAEKQILMCPQCGISEKID